MQPDRGDGRAAPRAIPVRPARGIDLRPTAEELERARSTPSAAPLPAIFRPPEARAFDDHVRRRAVLATIDDGFRRDHRRERAVAALTGAFAFFVTMVAFPAPSSALMTAAAVIGAGAGACAHVLGDRWWSWAVASLAGAAALSPMASGSLYTVLVVVLGAVGAGTGLLRAAR